MSEFKDWTTDPVRVAELIRDCGECAYKYCPWPAFRGYAIIPLWDTDKPIRRIGVCTWHSFRGPPTRRQRKRRPKEGLLHRKCA